MIGIRPLLALLLAALTLFASASTRASSSFMLNVLTT